MKKKRIPALLLAAVLSLALFAGCGQSEVEEERKENLPQITALEDLAGCKVGVLTGSVNEQYVREQIPGCEIVYFNAITDMPVALSAGKLDAFVEDDSTTRFLLKQYADLCKLTELCPCTYGFIFPKNEAGQALRDQVNEYLADILADGTMAQFDRLWFEADEAERQLDFSGLTGENGTLSMAVSTDVGYPFVYLSDGQMVGYDVNIALEFCRRYGYGLELTNYNFSGLLAAVSTEKAQFGASGITMTEERAESLYFSEPDYYSAVDVIVRRAQDTDAAGADSNEALLASLTGKRIGVLTGGWCDVAAEQSIPECQVVYFNTNPDIALALDAGKIDAYMTDETVALKLLLSYPDQQIRMNVLDDHYGVVFRKDDPESDALRAQLDEYIAQYLADGTAEAMKALWFGTDTAAQTIDFSGLTGENGTLSLAVASGVGEPSIYLKDGQYAGYDVDLIVRFCRAYGYGLNISDSEFSGVLTAVAAGKCDFGVSSISITAERLQSMNFSEPYYDNHAVLVMRSDSAAAPAADASDGGFWSSVRDSFQKTFLRESRWRLFVGGIGITVLITLISAVCGSLLGFGMYMLYRKKLGIPNAVMIAVVDFMQKTPMVVVLMILYYIIFGSTSLSGVFVSCIGFGLAFACAVAGRLKVAVGAVDHGQTEAALALGYTDTRAFLRIILPQALRHFLPGYQNEIVSLLKSTAIVGYIAVQDLTKISDIVRSRTYEAFFPLIASAVIYFAIAWLLTILIRRIRLRVEIQPQSAKRELKGVRTK